MKKIAAFFIVAVVALSTALARADVKPNNLFSDHMVLQASTTVPVWGTAAPGEQVTVTLPDQKQSTAAGPDGKWMVHLASLKPGGPFEMTIAGNNSITVHDVLVGEVWLGSGQSNMQFPVGVSPVTKAYNGVTNMDQEIAAANYPQLRMYTVKTLTPAQPQDDTVGQWEVCTPDTVKAFSAIGYFFSRDLQKELNVPIGFINSSYGASTAEAWVSKPVLDADPRFAPMMKNFQNAIDTFAARPATAPAPIAAALPTPAPTTQAATRAARGRRGRG
nr:hypothetical protein [Planctomycetota bacterium]